MSQNYFAILIQMRFAATMNMITLKFTSVTVVGLLFALFGHKSLSVAVAQPQTTPPKPKYQYPQEIIETYITLCTRQSVDQGLTPQQAKTLCDCTLNQFQAQYSLDEFIQIYTQVNQSQETPEEWIDIGLACAEELGVTYLPQADQKLSFSGR